jgi:hypothetical protein
VGPVFSGTSNIAASSVSFPNGFTAPSAGTLTLKGEVIIPATKAIRFASGTGTVILQPGSVVATVAPAASNAVLSVPANADSAAKLTVGSSTPGTLTIGANKAVTASGTASFTGAVTFGGAASFAGAATFADVTLSDNTTKFGGATFASTASFTDTASFANIAVFKDDVTLTKGTTFTGDVFVADAKKITLANTAAIITLKSNAELGHGAPSAIPAVYSGILGNFETSPDVTLTPALAGTTLTFGGTGTKSLTQSGPDGHGITIGGKATLIPSAIYKVGDRTGSVGGALTLASSAELKVGKDILSPLKASGAVGSRIDNVDTTSASLVLTGASGIDGAILKGAGSLAAGGTAIVGGATGGWQVVDEDSTPGTVTITTDTITATTATAVLTGVAGATITVAKQKTLTIGEATTVNLGGTTALAGASITLTGDTGGGGTLALSANTSKVLVGMGTGGADIGGVGTVTITGKSVTVTDLTPADLKVVTDSSDKKLVQIGGTSVGSLKAGTDNVVINSAAVVTGS